MTLLFAIFACSAGKSTGDLSGDAWADNWFSLYLDESLVIEDSVPITTERAFNAESFSYSATAPYQLALILKDFKETDSGLEYIGESNQQMGDGGFILQIFDGSDVVVVSDTSWRCLVIHTAPLNTDWDASAELIWGPSLTQDNTILCRLTVE